MPRVSHASLASLRTCDPVLPFSCIPPHFFNNLTNGSFLIPHTGIKFTSQTDTEVIAQLIGTYLDQNLPIMEAVKKTLSRLEGTWGLAIICKNNPDQIIAVSISRFFLRWRRPVADVR